MKTFLIILALLSAPVFAQDGAYSPRFLVHLLDYLAKDYGGAVQHGKIISPSEYQEQIEFSNSAIETNRNLLETKNHPEIISQLIQLQKLIQNKESDQKVAALARSIQSKVIQIANLEVAPLQWPSLKSGKEIFAQNCVSCHGSTGAGNGLAGAALNPKPANFLDEHMKEISPFQAFNTIRLGVPGTGMVPFHALSDKEVWDVAFYVESLRHQKLGTHSFQNTFDQELLKRVAISSDEQLGKSLSVDEKKTGLTVTALRISSDDDSSASGSLNIARSLLHETKKLYENKDYALAKTSALRAYLEGIEPVEPRLKATDPRVVSDLEMKMAGVRGAIEDHVSFSDFQLKVKDALDGIDGAGKLLSENTMSPGLAFTAAATVILREGFEAVLIIIALLSVIRASGSTRAAFWVHGGWISALAIGALLWVFAGFLMNISGAQRETLEGATSIFAVIVLLVVGFWLHSQTEIGRWKAFIHGRVQKALDGKNLWALASIAFIAVFREAMETILFLKAISFEGAQGSNFAVAAGVLSSLALVIAMAWAILRYSAKLPIRKLFEASAVMMAVLAVILTGKGLHSFQEIGLVGVNNSPISFHFDLLGLYPTWQTLISQIMILGLVIILWNYSKKPVHSHSNKK